MQHTFVLLAMVVVLFAIFYTCYYLVEDKKQLQKIKNRIDSVNLVAGSTSPIHSIADIRINRESLLEKKLNAMFSANKTGENLLQLKFYRCAIKLDFKKIGIFLLLTYFTFFIIADLFTPIGWIYSIFVGLGGTIGFSYVLLNFLEKRRRKKILAQLSTAVEIILRGIRSGSSVERTFQIVSRELTYPLKDEFNQITKELEFGVSFEKVLHNAATRINVSEFYFFTTALMIQRKSGGSLSDVLENIIHSLSRIQEIRMKIKIYSSEAKTSGYVLGCLPAIIWVILMHVKPEHIAFFHEDPLGRKILMIAIGLFLSAFVMIKRMVNLEV